MSTDGHTDGQSGDFNRQLRGLRPRLKMVVASCLQQLSEMKWQGSVVYSFPIMPKNCIKPIYSHESIHTKS
jgi:hypothetical protein